MKSRHSPKPNMPDGRRCPVRVRVVAPTNGQTKEPKSSWFFWRSVRRAGRPRLYCCMSGRHDLLGAVKPGQQSPPLLSRASSGHSRSKCYPHHFVTVVSTVLLSSRGWLPWSTYVGGARMVSFLSWFPCTHSSFSSPPSGTTLSSQLHLDSRAKTERCKMGW
jgi:hypothetical protein